MNADRKKDIKLKATEINNLSEQFQLLHATYAVEEYIKNIAKEIYAEKLTELTLRIQNKMQRDLRTDAELEEKKQLEKIIKRNRISIDISYIDINNEDIARVVKVDNAFTIYLAASLRDSIRLENGKSNYAVIRKIRRLMSHELGHLVLHTKDLLVDDSTQGSLNICDEEKEQEANIFRDELLYLRKKRNKEIEADGGAPNLY